jgi:uncharacterized protein (TIGR02217 family)
MSGAFLESPRFPDDLATWSKSGVGWSNQVITVKSGREQRNQLWTYPRARFDIANALRVPGLSGTRQTAWAGYSVQTLRDWIITMQGQYSGFRFKDFTDFLDEGTGVFTAAPDGTTTVFQLAKNYTIGAVTMQRAIYKPITSPAIQVFDNGSPVSPSVDTTTGLVTFSPAPSSGHTLTWTGNFDIPVRFAVDLLDYALDPAGLYVVQSIPLIEIRI